MREVSSVNGRAGQLHGGAEREYDTPHLKIGSSERIPGRNGPHLQVGRPASSIIEERDNSMEEQQNKRVAGIDVSKAGLEVWVEAGPARGFPNNEKGIGALVEWLERHGVNQAVYEPTGGYELGVGQRLRKGGIKTRRVHPNKVRGLARAWGKVAKTDGVDAKVLRRYGEVFSGREEEELEEGPERAEIREKLRRRRQLVSQRVQELNRLDKPMSPGVRESIEEHIEYLDKAIKRMDREYERALKSSSALSERAKLYQSVRGVGQLTAATLVAELPELGQGEGKRLTSLVGLAPWSRDSGRQRGYRAIQGGRGPVRRALYMAAMSAVRRRDSSLGRFHQQLRKRGKPGKVALVAVMRKMLMQLHAVAQRGTPWTEEYAPGT